MRQIVVTRPGGHGRLAIREAPDPRPGAGEIAVEVEAAGVNYADVAVRLGVYDAVREYPMCPGFEVAGRVAEAGEGVHGFADGDPVVAVRRFGGYADRVVVESALTWKRPDHLDAPHAAALPVNLATAWYATHGLAHARAGERVLIHSAAGGVGLMASQVCRLDGLHATGVVGLEAKADAARRFGCAEVIVAEHEDVAARMKELAPFDVVLDANGVSTLRMSYDALAPAGRLVVYGFASMLSRGRDRISWPAMAWRFLRTPRFSPIDLVMGNKSVLGFNLVHLFHSDRLKEEIVAAVRAVSEHADFMTPPVRTFPFEEVAAAHALIESGRSVGKIVLTP